jgi:AraC-like DNA-binding protein
MGTPGGSHRAAGDDGGRLDVAGLLRDDVLLEWSRYPPGPPVALPSHSHEEYQLNLNLDLPAGVSYRGAFHVVPVRRLTVTMPGESHRPRDPDHRQDVSAHLVLNVRPPAIAAAAGGPAGRAGSLPAFAGAVVDDPDLVGRFVRLHRLLAEPCFTLDQEVRLVSLLADLTARHAPPGAAQPLRPAHRAVRRAQEYLHDHRAADVSLGELSQVSGLSPYHLTRVFHASLGMPPHAYQIQLRIEHAKRLLLAGRSVSDSGHDAGFFDLSHFSRHFKRHVGVPPGVYARRARPEGRRRAP